LARFQLIPMRARLTRTASPVSRRGVIPRSNQTSATVGAHELMWPGTPVLAMSAE
jgi:hypothetical protein